MQSNRRAMWTMAAGVLACTLVAVGNSTPQTLPNSQNWTNTGLITTNDLWTNVPGIVGFKGDGLTAVTGTNPQTILSTGSGSNNVVNVLANQSNPNTQTTGGVAEFHATLQAAPNNTNPTMALQGSGTANAPSIVLYLDTTGMSTIVVAYNLRDIDGSADNAITPVALQYRVGTTGSFTNVPAGFVADATTGPGLATLVTPVNAILPAACDNQPQVQVRIITTDSVGSDEWVGIDDIGVSGTPCLVTWYADADSDLYGNPLVTQSACVQPLGYVANNLDCNDSNAAIHPGAQEVCDAADIDEDCDGLADNNDPSCAAAGKVTYYLDADGDGHGNPGAAQQFCPPPPAGYVGTFDDCDDGCALCYPGGTETCDGHDNDCDGAIDEDITPTYTYYRDSDDDTYGVDNALTNLITCVSPPPLHYSITAGDCNDSNPGINPGATEVCDSSNADEDCDGLVNDNDPSCSDLSKGTWYRDADGDSYGDAADSVLRCVQPPGYVTNDDDCNDACTQCHPGGVEVCDALDVDEDCDGLIDELDPSAQRDWYADSDADGFGDPDVHLVSCEDQPGYVNNDDDCDDSNGAVHPFATEICDASDIDDDCDGLVDEADPDTESSTWYADADGDGYGNVAMFLETCEHPAGYVLNHTDCDDGCASCHPGGVEICDGHDQDCDGAIDEDVAGAPTWYLDADDDGYGVDSPGPGGSNVQSCNEPPPTPTGDGYSLQAGDCDDTDEDIHPGATELCDGEDQDCDGLIDEGNPDPATVTWIGGGLTNHWSEGANWSTGHPPTQCANVVIDMPNAEVVLDTIASVHSVKVGTQFNGPPRIFILLPSSGLSLSSGQRLVVLANGVLRVDACAAGVPPPCPHAVVTGDIDCDGLMELMPDSGVTVTGSLFVRRGMNSNVRSTALLGVDFVAGGGGGGIAQVTLHEGSTITAGSQFKCLIDSALNLEDDGLALTTPTTITAVDVDLDGDVDVAAGEKVEINGAVIVGDTSTVTMQAASELTVTGPVAVTGAGLMRCLEGSSLTIDGDLTMTGEPGAGPGSPPSLARLHLGGGSNVVITGDTDGDLFSVIERINDGSTAMADLETILKNLGLLACRSGGNWNINLNPTDTGHTSLGAVAMEGELMTIECADGDTIECDAMTASNGTVRWSVAGADLAVVTLGDVTLTGGDVEFESSAAGANIAATMNGNVAIGDLSAMRARALGGTSGHLSSCTIETGPDSTLRGNGYVVQYRESDWDFVACTVLGEVSPGDADGAIGRLRFQSPLETTTFTLDVGSTYRVDLGDSNAHDEIEVEGDCAIVPRSVLKSFFQTGDFPTQPQRVMSTSGGAVTTEGFAAVHAFDSSGLPSPCAPSVTYAPALPAANDVFLHTGAALYYDDDDGDGYGDYNDATPVTSCAGVAGHAPNNTDCDDGDDAIHPGATDVANGIDDDCDGAVDEPLNDDFDDALVVADGPTVFMTTGATTDGGQVGCGFGPAFGDVWFTYTPTCTGTATISTCGSSFDTVLALYADCGAGMPSALSEIACNDDDCGLQSTVTAPVISGQCYRIRVGGFDAGDSGLGLMMINCGPYEYPPNDLCTNGITINDGVPAPFNITNASLDGPPTSSCVGAVDREVWFDYIATCTGMVQLTFDRDADDGVGFGLYNTDTCPAAPATGLMCSAFDAVRYIPVTNGQHLKIRVYGYGGWTGVGTGTLVLTCYPTPANDNCIDAQTLSDGVQAVYDTRGSTRDGPNPTCAFTDADAGDVWFRYVATCTGDAVLTIDPDEFGHDFIVYGDDCECPTGSGDEVVLCSLIGFDGGTRIFPVTAGQCYKVRFFEPFNFDERSPVHGTLQISCVAAPANDACAGATRIGLGTTAFDGSGSTLDGPASSCWPTADGDVWFTHTATCTGELRVEIGDGNGTYPVSIFEGCACPPTVELGCASSVGGAKAMVLQGSCYLIRVGKRFDGASTLTLTCTPAPVNDSCADATDIFDGVTEFSTTGATSTGPTTNCGDISADVWHKYTATNTGFLTVFCVNADFDGLFALYDACGPAACSTLSELACCGPFQTMTIPVVAGNCYMIRAGTNPFGSPGGMTQLTLTFAAPLPNDSCDQPATAVTGTTTFDLGAATLDGPPTSCGGGFGDFVQDAWFTYTASCTGSLSMFAYNTATSQSLGMTVYSTLDCPADTLDEIGCDVYGFSGVLIPSVTVGQQFKIRVGSTTSALMGPGALVIQCTTPPTTPPNDACANAIAIGNGDIPYDVRSATPDGPVPTCFMGWGDLNDVWFNWTAPCTGYLRLSSQTFNIPGVAVYSNSNCATLGASNMIGCGWMNEFFPLIPVTAGNVYKIQLIVPGFSTPHEGVMRVECIVPASNDSCAARLTVTDGATPFSTVGATTDGGMVPASPFPYQIGNDIWFSYTPSCSGALTVSLCGSSFDTALAVYKGCNIAACPPTAAPEASSNDQCGDDAQVTFQVLANQCYKIRVGGYFAASGSGTMNITFVATDLDEDGYSICEGDCNDANAAVHPGALEVCDGVDNDCDTNIDEESPSMPSGVSANPNPACTGASVLLSAVASPGSVCQWFLGGCGGGAPIHTGASLSVTATGSTTYFVRSYNATTNCVSACAEITVNAHPPAGAGAVVTANPNVGCGPTLVNLQATGFPGGDSVEWFLGACPPGAGATPLGSGASINVMLPANAQVFAQFTNSAGCVNPTCLPVTLTIETPTTWYVDPDNDGYGTPGGTTTSNCDDDPPAGYADNDDDNCPTVFNPGQEDADTDGVGDACEAVLTQFTIQLQSVSAASLQRCLRLEFVDLPPLVPNDPLTVDVDVTFNNGTATFTVPGVECGDYDCVRVRDRKHTLATTTEIISTPTGCEIVLTGDDALLGGNLNDDPYVDILDFGLFVGRYGTFPGAASPCSLQTVHADINGDGMVTVLDYSFIFANFLATSDSPCGTVVRIAAPRTSISVPELFEIGLGELVVADITGDGILDMDDVAEYFNGGPQAGEVAIYIGAADGLWSDPANWSGGIVPDANSDVVITDRVVIDAQDAVAQQVLVIPDAALILLPGAIGNGQLRCEFLRVFDGGRIELACDGCGIEAADFVLEGDGPLLWSAGTLSLRGGTIDAADAPLTVSGVLQGTGAITGDGDGGGGGWLIVQNGGVIAPHSTLTIAGDASLPAEGALRIGLHPGACDVLEVGGVLTLGGTLDVSLDDRVEPRPGDRWVIIRTGAIQGRFDRVNLPALTNVVLSVRYEGNSVIIACDASP